MLLHAAEIEVDEEGTKASAVTTVVVFQKRKIFQPIKFHVNRPFIAFLYHRPASTILFTAIVHRPT